MAQAKKSTSKKSSAKKSGTKKKTSAKRKSTKKKSSAKKSSARRSQEFSGKSVADFRKALTERLVEPLNLVMLTRDRIEETVEAARDGLLLPAGIGGYFELGLVERGRRQVRRHQLEAAVAPARAQVRLLPSRVVEGGERVEPADPAAAPEQ